MYMYVGGRQMDKILVHSPRATVATHAVATDDIQTDGPLPYRLKLASAEPRDLMKFNNDFRRRCVLWLVDCDWW